MKKIFNQLFLSFISLFLFSCEKVNFDFLDYENGKVDDNFSLNSKSELLNNTSHSEQGLVFEKDFFAIHSNAETIDQHYEMGVRLLSGPIPERDYKEAAKFLTFAAEMGHHGAQFKLGSLYEHGIGVKKNLDTSFEWFTKSAEGQNVYAQNQLGWIYTNGHRVNKDYDQAVRWFKLASQRNYCVAQANLSTMYRDGKGVKQDYALAKTWWNLALESDTENILKSENFYRFQVNR